MAKELRHGGCLCGAVRYIVAGPLRPVVECHCRQCRRIHGHVAAYTAAAREAITLIEESGLRWYTSSPGFRRGFCGVCGASVFWERLDGRRRSIAAGTLDKPTGLQMIGRIFTADAGDYYDIDDSLPCYAGSDDGALGSDSV